MLTGPNGDSPATKNFTLDASGSSDPDNPAASLRYDFDCAPQPCFLPATYTGEAITLLYVCGVTHDAFSNHCQLLVMVLLAAVGLGVKGQ